MNFKPPVPILRQHTRLFFFALLVVSSSIILAGAYWQHLGIISAVLLSVGTSLLAGTLASIFDKAFGITNTLAEKLARSFTDRVLLRSTLLPVKWNQIQTSLHSTMPIL